MFGLQVQKHVLPERDGGVAIVIDHQTNVIRWCAGLFFSEYAAITLGGESC